MDRKNPAEWPVGHYGLIVGSDPEGRHLTVNVKTGEGVRVAHWLKTPADMTDGDAEEWALRRAREFLQLDHADPNVTTPGAVRSPYSHAWPQPDAYKVSGLEAADDIAGHGAKAVRVELADLDARVVQRTFVRHGVLTVCILDLDNGFTITGQSACADPANYDEVKGRHFASEDALRSLWPLEGYLLRERLVVADVTNEGRLAIRHALEAARHVFANSVDEAASDEDKAELCRHVDNLGAALDHLTLFEMAALGKAYDPTPEGIAVQIEEEDAAEAEAIPPASGPIPGDLHSLEREDDGQDA